MTTTAVAPRIDARRASGPAVRAFFLLSNRWKLTTEEQLILLGSPGRSTLFNWKKGQVSVLPHDTLERISYLLGVFKALNILLPDEHAADAWVRKPNDAPLFAGKSALSRMLSGNVSDLFVVRQYLDAQRSGRA